MSRVNPPPSPMDRYSTIESALRRTVESRRAVFARLSCPFGMDAVADRADTEVLDQYAVPDALMDEAGLIEPVG
jgi:hypothetical protein